MNTIGYGMSDRIIIVEMDQEEYRAVYALAAALGPTNAKGDLEDEAAMRATFSLIETLAYQLREPVAARLSRSAVITVTRQIKVDPVETEAAK